MKKTLACLLLAAVTALPGMALADTEFQNVVYDSHGSVVHTTLTGSCLRTKWVVDSEPCGAPGQAAVAVRKAHTLSQEERTVYFDFAKAALRPDGKAKLDTLAEVLKSDDQVKSARIVGYADRIGSSKLNDALSKKRAKKVGDYLVAKGFVKSQVVETRGLGKTAASAKCSNKLPKKKLHECLQPDRKVEVEIEYLPEQ